MANAYIHNSTLTDEQVRAILKGYIRFVSAKDMAAQVDVSRQTTHSLYLKFSQRLHSLRVERQDMHDEARRDMLRWFLGQEIQDAYAVYRDGPGLDEFRAARQGRMLSPEDYAPYVVSRELGKAWGKISEKTFVFHYALIRHVADRRIGAMQLLGKDDADHPKVVLLAAVEMFAALEEGLRKWPLGGRKPEQS